MEVCHCHLLCFNDSNIHTFVVGAQEGRLLYATTNKYSALDPALIRAGRMDIHVEFKLASKYQAAELFQCFYLPSGVDEKTDEKEKTKSNGHANPGNGHTNGNANGNANGTVTEKAPVSASDNSEKPLFVGRSHLSRAPQLPLATIKSMGQQFASKLPEREFSMASLQGYLMAYKTRPVEAIEDIEKWVEKERKEKAEKARKKEGVSNRVSQAIAVAEVVTSEGKESAMPDAVKTETPA